MITLVSLYAILLKVEELINDTEWGPIVLVNAFSDTVIPAKVNSQPNIYYSWWTLSAHILFIFVDNMLFFIFS